MSREDLDMPTVTDLWKTAGWMERQEYDFFGFNFVGHPNLKRILNMDEMNYFPMRKEYPFRTEHFVSPLLPNQQAYGAY